MNISVFGTGMVGQTIASRLLELGYKAWLGTRDAASTLNRTTKDRRGISFAEWFDGMKGKIELAAYDAAAASADIIFNCTSGDASIAALHAAGSVNLKGKILIDVANPLDFSKGMPPVLNPCNDDS